MCNILVHIAFLMSRPVSLSLLLSPTLSLSSKLSIASISAWMFPPLHQLWCCQASCFNFRPFSVKRNVFWFPFWPVGKPDPSHLPSFESLLRHCCSSSSYCAALRIGVASVRIRIQFLTKMRIRTDFSHFSAFPDPALHQKDANKRPLLATDPLVILF